MTRRRSLRRLAAAALAVALAVSALSAGSAGAQSLPGSPSITSVTPGSGKVTVAWDAPSDTGGTGVTVSSYDLRWIASAATDKSDANWTVVDSFWTSGQLSGDVSGLDNGVGYDFQMRATAAAGDGAWSATTTGAPRDSAPAITAMSVGEQAFTVAWTAPAEITSTDTVTYRVRWILSSATDKSDSHWSSATATAEPGWHAVRGLTNLSSYDVQVQAVSDHSSAWSATSTVTPMDAPDSRGAAGPQIALGAPAAGSVDSAADEDYFTLVLTAPALLMLRTTGALGNSICWLRDSTGVKVAGNDDGEVPGDEEQCLIVYPAAAGTYEVSVRGIRVPSPHTGQYLLHAVAATGPGTTRAAAMPLAKGQVGAGNVSSPSDTDWISVTGGAADEHVTVSFRRGVSLSGHNITATLVDAADKVLARSIDSACEVTPILFGAVCLAPGFQLDFLLPANTTRWIKLVALPGLTNNHGPYAVTMQADADYASYLSRCAAAARPAAWSDVLSGCQWHLNNTGQVGGTSGEDANVLAAHAAGFLGAGVTVAVVDDGFSPDHADLAGNASDTRSRSFCPRDPLAFSRHADQHGIAVAGIVAARDNTIGMRGVAPRAQLYNVRLLDCEDKATSVLSAGQAMAESASSIAVSVNSWGKRSIANAKPVSAVWEKAVEQGLRSGFAGKGTVYVFAGGNGVANGDWSALDEYVTHHGTIPVCAVNAAGRQSSYSERGPNLWVCAPSSDSVASGMPRIATLARNHRYYEEGFGGTSAAAPIVGGVAALVRAENTALTWRDVKLVLADSARRNLTQAASWQQGAPKYSDDSKRYWFSHAYGFGVVDAHAAVMLGKNWKLLPPMITATQTGTHLLIPDDSTSVTASVTFDDEIEFVEYVEIDTNFNVASFRQLRVELVSPSGAVSLLSPENASAAHHALKQAFRFGSSRHLGESAKGDWTLRISDRVSGSSRALLVDWSVTLYGHRRKPTAPTLTSAVDKQGSLTVTWQAPARRGSSALTGYEIRHISSSATDRSDSQWTTATVPGGASALTHTLTAAQLASAAVDVQVRARNSDAAGPWSSTLSATTTPNRDPSFGATSATRSIAENTAAGVSIGGPVAATDPDATATLTYSLGGTHASSFTIDTSTGQLSTNAALDYEAQAAYSLTVSVSDGLNWRSQTDTSADDSVNVTVSVTDANETETLTVIGILSSGETLLADLDSGDCTGSGRCPGQYTWQTSTDGSNWFSVHVTPAAVLTLDTAHECREVRVSVRYTDAHGSHQLLATAGNPGDKVWPATGDCTVQRQQPPPGGGNPPPPPGGGNPPPPPGGGNPPPPPGGGGPGPGGGGGGDDEDGDGRGEAVRLWGADRYATSLEVARQVAELNDGKLDTAVVAGGHSWTDALVAGPLAGALDAALLLTAPGGLPDDTVAWLAELGVSEIIAVGDTDTITPDALNALNHLDPDIERITADNPYAASIAVARRVGQPATLGPLLGRTVIVASGRVFADALAAGPLAAYGPHPIAYADEGTLHPQVAAYLAEHADHVIIMGGTAAVTEGIETQIRAIPQANRTGERPMAVTRLGGADRYATAVAFARWLNTPILEGRHCFTPDTVGLATGIKPADAAASAPLLARRCSPLLLTQPDRIPTITASYLRRTSELIVFGGTAAINRTALRDWDQ